MCFFLQETRSLLNEFAWPQLDPQQTTTLLCHKHQLLWQRRRSTTAAAERRAVWSFRICCLQPPDASECPSKPFAAADLCLLVRHCHLRRRTSCCCCLWSATMSADPPYLLNFLLQFHYLLISNEIELETLTMKLLISHLILTMTI